jgi:alpha-galactosidase
LNKMTMKSLFFSLAFALLLVAVFTSNPIITPVQALNNGLALTPPMGWNSWNYFGKLNINETVVRETIDALVTTGMKDLGYTYVVIDGGWRDTVLAPNGDLQTHPTRFPNGIKPLADYAHSKGLKLGLHCCPGTHDCGGDLVGCEGHEQQHANQFAAWGVDFIKYDWCGCTGNKQQRYELMGNCLQNTGRSFLYSISAYNFYSFQPDVGNMWRTTGDIADNWSSMISRYDGTVHLGQYAGPGHWNDPDMLEVGNGGMTDTEYKTHFSLWAIMAAPLIAGNDVRNMTQATKNILMNTEVIAVNQDPDGIQATKVSDTGELEILSKPLHDGSRAVVLLNRGSGSSNITASWSQIGLLSGNGQVRDLWVHQDLGTYANSFTATVPSHGVVMVKITGQPATPTPTPVPLAADWNLDENSGATANDSTGNGFNGSITGAAWITGHSGSGLSFNGSGYVRAAAPSSRLKPASQVALSAWIKAGLTDTSGAEIASMGDSYFLRVLTDGNVRFSFYNGSAFKPCSTSGINVLNNNWHHIVGQKTADGVEIYVDGVLQSSLLDNTETISYTKGPDFYIGKNGNGNTTYDFTGVIDEVKVYSTSLTLAQIKALYTTTTTTVDDSQISVITYSGTWTHNTGQTNCYNNTNSSSSITNDYAELSFNGTSIKLYVQKGPGSGYFDVYLDSQYQTTYDGYANPHQFQVLVYENNTLTPGQHLIKVMVKGQKNPSATGYFLNLDYFTYN